MSSLHTGNLLVVSFVICRVTDPCSFVHEAPVAPGPRTVKRTSRRGGGGLGNLSLHLSIVIFISFILTSSSSFSFVLSVFVSFSSVPFCSYHILPYLIWIHAVPSLFLLSSPLFASPGSPPCLRSFHPAPLSLSSFRTLSPCHFLFPVGQLSFLFLCY